MSTRMREEEANEDKEEDVEKGRTFQMDNKEKRTRGE